MKHIDTNLQDEDYRNIPQLGSTDMKRFIDDPEGFFLERKYEKPQNRKKVFDIGNMIHSMTLGQPITIKVSPNYGKRSKKDRKMWQEWFQSNGFDVDTDRPVSEWDSQHEVHFVEHKDIKLINGCIASLMKSFGSEINTYPKEVTAYTEHFKARLDLIDFDNKVIYDIKTIDGIGNITSNMRRMKMYYQSAHYLKIINRVTGDDYKFVWLFVSKREPYLTRKVILDHESMITARNKMAYFHGNYIELSQIKNFMGDKITVITHNDIF